MVKPIVKPIDLAGEVNSPGMSEHLVRVSRLKELQQQRGWSDAELARQCARHQQQVRAWWNSTRPIGEKLARSLEEALKLPRFWLDERPGPAPTLGVREGLRPYGEPVASVIPASHSGTKVPVLSWELLSTMLETANSKLSSSLERLTTFAEASQAAKFVVMPDDSMEPVFSAGDHVLIDPALLPRAGDVVLVRLPTGELLLRMYRPRSALVWEAAPLNTYYQPVSSDKDQAEVAAVMVEHRRYRRR